MVQPKWFAFMAFVWITLTFLGATLEQHDAPSTWEGNTEVTTLNYLTNFKNISFQQKDTQTWSFVGINPEYFKTLVKISTWDFDFMQTDIGNMVRWIVFVPFVIAFLAMLAFEFIMLIQGFIPFT